MDGKTLELRVSGKVRRGNLVMYDKETDTLWLQATGEALDGVAKAQGKHLKELAKNQWEAVRWADWRAKHPDTLVLFCEHCQATLPKGTLPQ